MKLPILFGKISGFVLIGFLLFSVNVYAALPNILLIMADDMGYSDIGSYGGEIDTPNIDALAEKGVRFSQFYNTARCSTTRASLLAGRYPHKVQMGHLAGKRFNHLEGYRGDLARDVKILPEILSQSGYKNYMVGKWHLANYGETELQVENISDLENTPNKRGFDAFYGTLLGGNNYFSPKYLFRNERAILAEGDEYYYTDAISHEAVRFINSHMAHNKEQPFFLYAAYTAPHFPIQAPAESIKKYQKRYQLGWDAIREQRYNRMVAKGIIARDWSLSHRDEEIPAWRDADNKTWHAQRMAVHAAMIDHMDQGIGAILSALSESGELDSTLVILLSHNGASAEAIPSVADDPKLQSFFKRIVNKYAPASGEEMLSGNDLEVAPGGKAVFQTIGPEWANASNTPFRKYKSWVHEGGIATPLLIQWPEGIKGAGNIIHEPGHVVDIMTTILDAAGIEYRADDQGGNDIDGVSLLPLLHGKNMVRGPIYFEHQGNRAVRDGNWKLVAPLDGDWELYNMARDRTETNDLAQIYPERVLEMSKAYENYASRNRVILWRQVLEMSSSNP